MSVVDSYTCFADLETEQKRGVDFEIFIYKQNLSSVVIVAPHGGEIERGTSQVARRIAAEDFNLYLFEGLKPSLNFETLHISSHLFDEPECLSLISSIENVITIHGCNGKEETVYLGGLNETLKSELANALNNEGITQITEDHKYPGKHPDNICNRGLSKQGVQIELTDTLRGTPSEEKVVKAIRVALLNRDGE